uniref:Uncharacterized protein n=1 Tax=Tetranychus urticae TaxID=32264 RepID=T1KMJ0_TETUR
MIRTSTLVLTSILSCVFAQHYGQDESELYFAPRENYPGYPYPYQASPYEASPYEQPVETYGGYKESPFQQRMFPSIWPPFRLWRKPVVKHPETLPEQPIPVYEPRPKKTRKVKGKKLVKLPENNYEPIKQQIQPQPVHQSPPNYIQAAQAEKHDQNNKCQCKCSKA